MNQPLVRAFLANLWRRWPITIVTTTLAIPIASWAYMHMTVSSVRASTSNTTAEQNIPTKPSGAVAEARPSHVQEVAKKQRTLPAFRRVDVGPNEVDYVAEDVTVRVFTRTPKPRTVAGGGNQMELGDDVTVHYFADNQSAKADR